MRSRPHSATDPLLTTVPDARVYPQQPAQGPLHPVSSLVPWAAAAWSSFIDGSTAPFPSGPVPRAELAGHGLLPLIARGLSSARDPRADELRADAIALDVIQRTRLVRLSDVVRALECAGCTPVLIKGASFIARFCSDQPGLRPSGDFDVLVGPGTLDRASQAFLEAGLRSTTSLDRPSRRLDKARSWVLEDGGPTLEVDLHQRLDAWPLFTTLEHDVRRDASTLQGFRVPSMHAMVGIISLHVMRSAYSRPLREHLDLLTLLYHLQEENPDRLLDKLERWRLLGAFLGTLQQAAWIAAEVSTGASHRRRLLEQTRRRLGPVRSALVRRLSPPDRSLRPSLRLRHPLVRRTILPMTSGEHLGRILLSTVVYGGVRRGEDTLARLRRPSVPR